MTTTFYNLTYITLCFTWFSNFSNFSYKLSILQIIIHFVTNACLLTNKIMECLRLKLLLTFLLHYLYSSRLGFYGAKDQLFYDFYKTTKILSGIYHRLLSKGTKRRIYRKIFREKSTGKASDLEFKLKNLRSFHFYVPCIFFFSWNYNWNQRFNLMKISILQILPRFIIACESE